MLSYKSQERRRKFLEAQSVALTKKLVDCEEAAKQAKTRLSDRERMSISAHHGSGDSTKIIQVVDEEINILLLGQCTEIMPAIRKAIRFIKKAPDLYGICPGCLRPISEKRLKAIPWATFCLRCQEE